jgi:hypothetical protein
MMEMTDVVSHYQLYAPNPKGGAREKKKKKKKKKKKEKKKKKKDGLIAKRNS